MTDDGQQWRDDVGRRQMELEKARAREQKADICSECEEPVTKPVRISNKRGDLVCCEDCALLCEDCGELFHPDDEGSTGLSPEHWCNDCC